MRVATPRARTVGEQKRIFLTNEHSSISALESFDMSAPAAASEASPASTTLEVTDVEFCLLHLRQSFIDAQVQFFPNASIQFCVAHSHYHFHFLILLRVCSPALSLRFSRYTLAHCQLLL